MEVRRTLATAISNLNSLPQIDSFGTDKSFYDDNDDLSNNFPSTNNIECKYLLESDLYDFLNPKALKNVYNINIMHMNCRSLSANFSEVNNLISLHNFTFTAVAVTETWLNMSNESLYQIQGYKFYSCV